MATKAYLMINVKKEFCQNGRMENIVADLETIPGLKCIEQIDGVCDLLVHIEAPIRAVFVANKVLVMDWVEHLRLLKVQPIQTKERQYFAMTKARKLADATKSRLIAEAEQHVVAVETKASTNNRQHTGIRR